MQNPQYNMSAAQNFQDPNRSSIHFNPSDLTNSTADRPAKRRLKEGNSVQDVEQTNLIPISEGNNDQHDRRYTIPLSDIKYKVENEPTLPMQRKNGSILKRSRIEGRRSVNEPIEKQGVIFEQINSKKMKLVFREEIQEVNIIENWKEYNNIETTGVTTACHCNTF